MSTVTVGPYKIQWPFLQVTFNPEPANITAITNDANAVVTTDTEHGFIDGMIVQLFVNSNYGMEINKKTSVIKVIDVFNFATVIDTLSMSSFIIPIATQEFPAQAVPFSGIDFTGTVFNTYEQLATPS